MKPETCLFSKLGDFNSGPLYTTDSAASQQRQGLEFATWKQVVFKLCTQ